MQRLLACAALALIGLLGGCGDDAFVASTCEDGMQNGAETGVDCGGGACAACPEGESCRQNADCADGVCSDGGTCVAQSCTDGRLNAGESDVDCGGSCDPCAQGDRCASGDDCVSGRCDDGRCAAGVCGDGTVDDGEDCDDAGESADCNADCTAAVCGDSVVNDAAGEQCDHGGQATATCDEDCSLRSCGDSVTNPEAGETCDEGENTATCDFDCSAPECGDALTNTAAGEECDTAGDSYSCDVDCTAATCGDGYANAARFESCDTEGVDTADCDGGDCTAPVCGDSYLNEAAGEECDTAGVDSATCDSGDCTAPACGDGYTNMAAGEDCDDAGESATCDADCTAPACGDGVLNVSAGETCEEAADTATCDSGDCSAPACGDGYPNLAAGEECDSSGVDSATCNADCTAAECGDGYVNEAAGEECEVGDGCGADCQVTGLVSVSPREGFIFRLDPATYAEVGSAPLTVAGDPTATVAGALGLAKHPTTGELYILIKFDPSSPRPLGTVDPATGVVTVIGDPGLRLSNIAFSNDGTLYAVSGDGSQTPETLWTLDQQTAAPTLVQPLGNGNDGEVIATRPGDATLYHWSGHATPGEEIFESVDPGTNAVVNILTDFPEHEEVFAALWSTTDAAFVVFTIEDTVFLHGIDGSMTNTGLTVARAYRGVARSAQLPPLTLARIVATEEDPGARKLARTEGQAAGCAVASASSAAVLLLLALALVPLRRRRRR